MHGVFLLNPSKASKLTLRPSSVAMAGKCKTTLVEPPIAKSTRIAFSTAFSVAHYIARRIVPSVPSKGSWLFHSLAITRDQSVFLTNAFKVCAFVDT